MKSQFKTLPGATPRSASGNSFWVHSTTSGTRSLGANGQPALAAYNRDPGDGLLKPYALQVLSLRGGRISQVDGFVTPRFLPAFGLPDVLGEPAGP